MSGRIIACSCEGRVSKWAVYPRLRRYRQVPYPTAARKAAPPTTGHGDAGDAGVVADPEVAAVGVAAVVGLATGVAVGDGCAGPPVGVAVGTEVGVCTALGEVAWPLVGAGEAGAEAAVPDGAGR